jgi:hypothetical protein
VPVVRRVLELAYERQLIDQQIPIDQLLVKVKVKSPLAIARETTRVTRIIEWLQMVLAICEGTGNPAMAHYVAKIEEALRLIGREYGVPNDLILTTDEADKVKKADQAHQLALAAAQAGAGASMPAAAS